MRDVKRLNDRLLLGLSVLMCGGLLLFAACDSSSGSLASSALNAGSSGVTPLIDSNTNWLLTCSADSDCGAGEQCACGSCVIPCAPEGHEGPSCMTSMSYASPESVSCSAAEPVSEVSSCGEDYMRPHEGICLLGCDSNDQCPDHLLCHEGRCKRPRRGESRGCSDERECVEAGGDPMRCHVLCEEDDLPEAERMGPPPPPLMEELFECEHRCADEGNQVELCRSRCAVCTERCLLISDPEGAERCAERCSPEDEGEEELGEEDRDDAVDELAAEGE